MEYTIYVFNLVYNISDIFMVMYFGNEIKLTSDALSYSLFKSNWMEQPESCKKVVIIFGERLKQAQQLVVLKLYPLTLETFTRVCSTCLTLVRLNCNNNGVSLQILNAAYSMFNILKTLA